MELYNPTKYSFDELYFKILPEGRIRRRQYIGRMVGGGVLIGIIYLAASSLIGARNPVIISFGGLVLTIGGLYMWYILNLKRIRDIGKDSKVVKMITIGLIIWSIISNVYYSLGDNGWLPGYVSPFIQAMENLSKSLNPNYISSIQYPWHQLLFQYLGYPYGIISLGLFLYLFLIPGKKGDNEYGKDPMGTKLGFFG